MTSFFYSEPELVIALNTKIICVNPNDLQIFKEIFISKDITKWCPKTNDVKIEESDDKLNTSCTHQMEQPIIQQVIISPNHELMVVSTTGQKALLVYQLRLEHAKLVKIRSLAKTSSGMIFSKDSQRLLVTDKAGDCYEYCCYGDTEPKKLFGQLSIVYDVLWSPDENFIITCDRDDKIRITKYPETYEIHGYCLGHNEFVSTLQLLNDTLLISGSGDGTLRLWNIEKSEELCKLDLPAPIIKLVTRFSNTDNKYELAALLYKESNECVALFALSQYCDVPDMQEDSTADNWRFSKNIQIVGFSEMTTVCNICCAQDRLYVVGVINDHLCLRVVNEASAAPPENWLQMIEDQFKEIQWQPEDISKRFKKKYDNVTEYMNRKKRRTQDKTD